MDKYFVSSGYANIINSMVYIISAVASPFVGILVDQTGFGVSTNMKNQQTNKH